MIKYLIMAFALSAATPAASAMECRSEIPSSATEYWSWRVIDGKRCWYPGRPGMSKENLHWPKAEEATTGRASGAIAVESENLGNSSPIAPEQDRSYVSGNNGELTFEERWPGGR